MEGLLSPRGLLSAVRTIIEVISRVWQPQAVKRVGQCTFSAAQGCHAVYATPAASWGQSVSADNSFLTAGGLLHKRRSRGRTGRSACWHGCLVNAPRNQRASLQQTPGPIAQPASSRLAVSPGAAVSVRPGKTDLRLDARIYNQSRLPYRTVTVTGRSPCPLCHLLPAMYPGACTFARSPLLLRFLQRHTLSARP